MPRDGAPLDPAEARRILREERLAAAMLRDEAPFAWSRRQAQLDRLTTPAAKIEPAHGGTVRRAGALCGACDAVVHRDPKTGGFPRLGVNGPIVCSPACRRKLAAYRDAGEA